MQLYCGQNLPRRDRPQDHRQTLDALGADVLDQPRRSVAGRRIPFGLFGRQGGGLLLRLQFS